jgi:hypothetical protein
MHELAVDAVNERQIVRRLATSLRDASERCTDITRKGCMSWQSDAVNASARLFAALLHHYDVPLYEMQTKGWHELAVRRKRQIAALLHHYEMFHCMR